MCMRVYACVGVWVRVWVGGVVVAVVGWGWGVWVWVGGVGRLRATGLTT